MPDITDATLYRLMYESETAHLEYDLDVSLDAPGECPCCAEEGVTSCQYLERFAGGRIVLSCSNTATIWDHLVDAGFVGEKAIDAELVRCVEAAMAREQRAKEAA